MDIGTISGIIGGITFIILGIIMAQADLSLYVDMPSVMITIGGTVTSMFTAFGLKPVLGMGSILKHAFFIKHVDPGKMIEDLVSFSEKARREGLLALEDDVDEVQDEFLKKGIQLVVDGTDPEVVKNILMSDLNNIESRHMKGIAILELGAAIAPAFGMIGTLIGLILMLGNMDDKASLGRGMSAALITTMYGSMIANWLLIPLSTKLDRRHKEEMVIKEIMIEGTLSIQSGDNPRIVKEKLASYLPPSERDSLVGEGED